MLLRIVLRRVALAMLLLVLGMLPAMGADASSNPLALDNSNIYSSSLAALTVLLVVAVLLENAFALLFNWRVFQTYFSTRGIRTLIMLAVSLAVVMIFKLDVVASLIAAYNTAGAGPDAFRTEVANTSQPVSMFVTAMILAGGSKGVNNIMRALGYRSGQEDAEITAKPPANQAWLAIRVKRDKAAGGIVVKVQRIGPAAAVQNPPAPIAGVIGARRPGLGELLLRNINRFPPNGGYALEPDIVYEVTVEALDKQREPIPPPANLNKTQYRLAPGAIVDVDATL